MRGGPPPSSYELCGDSIKNLVLIMIVVNVAAASAALIYGRAVVAKASTMITPVPVVLLCAHV